MITLKIQKNTRKIFHIIRKKLQNAHKAVYHRIFSLVPPPMKARFTIIIPMSKGYVYLGMISRADSDGSGMFEQKNKFSVGDEVEIMKPSGKI